MKNKLLLTLLFITLLALIISYGCGGGSNTTQPVSLITPTTQENTDNMAYLIIRIKWPQLNTTKEQKDLIASMPADTRSIVVRVFEHKNPNEVIDYNNPDPNKILGRTSVRPLDTLVQIPIPLPPNSDPNKPNILPIIPVTVWAGAYDGLVDPNTLEPNGSNLLISVKKDKTLQLGQNEINLNLGREDLHLRANPIVLEGFYTPPPGSKIEASELTLKKSETFLTTKLVIESPDIPTPCTLIREMRAVWGAFGGR